MFSRLRVLFILAAALFCVFIAWKMQITTAPPLRDETHYWPHAQYLTSRGFPSLEQLRNYGELCTPLSLMIFGWADRVSGGGLPAARMVSLAAVFATIVFFVLFARGPDRRVLPAALCVLVFPYFLGVGIHIYPDSFATLFTLLGLIAFQRSLPWPGALAFALAISCRQYMIVFPVGLALWECIELVRRTPRANLLPALLKSQKLWAGATSVAVLASWIILWGGFGPPAEVKRQAVSTAQHQFLFYPQYALYGLACLALYFVLPRWLLFDRKLDAARIFSPRNLILLALIITGFYFFPPQDNFNYEIDNMGYFDRMIRDAVGAHSLTRQCILALFAWITVCSFFRLSLPSALLAVHIIILAKAHIAWDKYQLPMIVCLWFLVADQFARATQPQAPADERSPEPSPQALPA